MKKVMKYSALATDKSLPDLGKFRRWFTCKICAKPFWRHTCSFKKGLPATCSWACRRIAISGFFGNEAGILADYASGMSVSKVTAKYRTDWRTVHRFLEKQGVEIRPPGWYSAGARNSNYKGGSINADGYRIVSIEGTRYLEHRDIMSKFLKRKLTRNEHVHHLNGKKLDNRLDNLAVLTAEVHGVVTAKQFSSWKRMYEARITELERKLDNCKCQPAHK